MRRIDTEPLIITGGFASLIERARANGDFDVPQSRLVGVKTHVPDEYLVVSTRVLGLDPTDVESMTGAYIKTYQQIPIILKFFRKYLPGFEKAHISRDRADARRAGKPQDYGGLRPERREEI